MTPPCAQLAQTGWVEEDATALSLAADASALSPDWRADHWQFRRPRGGTEFTCLPSRPDIDVFIGTLESVASSPVQAYWEPQATPGLYTTLGVGPWMTPTSRTGVYVTPVKTEPAFPVEGIASQIQICSGLAVLAKQEAGRLEKVASVADDTREGVDDPGPTPLEIVLELKDGLDLTWDDAEGATGIDRNTFLNWQRTGAVPRPSTVRKLMRVYGLVSALESALGKDKSSAWLHAGAPSWIDVLKNGDLSAFESAVTAVADGGESRPSTLFSYRPGPEEEEDVPLPPRRQFKKSARSPARSKLPRRHD